MNPKLSMEPATQLAVFLSNRPGALVRVCEALSKAEINIHALATSDTVDHSVVRMVVSDPTKALMLLGEAGVLALEDPPGRRTAEIPVRFVHVGQQSHVG